MFQEIIPQEFPFPLPVPRPGSWRPHAPRWVLTSHPGQMLDLLWHFAPADIKVLCRATCLGFLQAGACPRRAYPWDTQLLPVSS